MGSAAIDYESDPSNPIFQRMVILGGRGWTVYELPEDPSALLKLVYESGDTIERATCEKFPWAHNAEVEDVSAPASDNFPNNTLWVKSNLFQDEEYLEELEEYNDPDDAGCADQGDGTVGACPMKDTVDFLSSESGPTIENTVVGSACGRLLSVVATEASSVALIYDITEITKPQIFKVIHLAESVKDKSVGLAYNDGTVGEIVPRSIQFLLPHESPSGKAALLITGEQSGTASLWNFRCAGDDDQTKYISAKLNSVPSSSAVATTSLGSRTWVVTTVISSILSVRVWLF